MGVNDGNNNGQPAGSNNSFMKEEKDISAERQRFARGQWNDALMARGGIASEAPIGARVDRSIAPEGPIHTSSYSTFDFNTAGGAASCVAEGHARIWNQDPTRVGNNNNTGISLIAAQSGHNNQAFEIAGRAVKGHPNTEEMDRTWNQAQGVQARGGGLTFPDSNVYGGNVSSQAARGRGVAQNAGAPQTRPSVPTDFPASGPAPIAPMAPYAPPVPAASIPTASVFTTLQTIRKAENGNTWHLICEEHINKRPETKQLRQGRSIPPPAASAEWNVWTVGSLEFEHVQGGLHLDYLREVLLRHDGVSRKKVNRATLVSLVRAERCRQINSGLVVRCPVGWVEDGHWYIYVQPL
ncbi:hypothetical protein DFP73DRAFT_619174 [Morchella snyderi]|nr:hypothetical protein DFP73DRAFT_619174 [Morchella snyderi]